MEIMENMKNKTVPDLRVRLQICLPLLAAAAVTSSGCATHLIVNRITDPTQHLAAGAPYVLNFTQYEITVTRRLKSCEGNFVVATQYEIGQKEVADPMRRYVIDMSSLQSPFKTTKLTLTYHDSGALKSLNASADDKTGEVISSVVTTVGKLLISDVKVTTSMARKLECTDEAKKYLAKAKTAKVEVEKLSVKLEHETAHLERLTAMAAAMGTAWGRTERQQMSKQIDSVFSIRITLAEANKQLQEALKKITTATQVTWPPHGEVFTSPEPVVPKISNEVLREWVVSESNSEVRDVQNKSAVWLRIEPSGPGGRKEPCSNFGKTCGDEKSKGLKYRVPVVGELLVCSQPTCEANKGEVLERKSGQISQLGQVYALPLKSRPFSNRTIGATFLESGRPTMLEVTSSATAEKIATTFGNVADQYVAARKGRKSAELDEVKAETELLKAKKELADTRKAMEPSADAEQQETADAFKADTAVLEAELAYLKAKAALDAARKAASP